MSLLNLTLNPGFSPCTQLQGKPCRNSRPCSLGEKWKIFEAILSTVIEHFTECDR